MDYLFSLKPNQTFSEGIKGLSKFQISGMSYSSVVQRGYEYLSAGAVYPNVEINTGKCELEVSGSYGEYEVVISQQGDKIYGSCDCPYEDAICKHLIASLLHLQNNVQTDMLQAADITEATIAKAEEAKSDFEKYVKDLPIEKLQELVLEFAPDFFRKEVMVKKTVKKGDTKKVEQSYSKAVSYINRLFDGELYYIQDFEKNTNKALEELRPFWQTHAKEIANELARFLKKVDEAFDNGYLQGNYDEGYDEYYEDTYGGEEVAAYIGDFIAAIPPQEWKYAITKVMNAKAKLDYDVCTEIGEQIITKIRVEDLPKFTDLVIEMELFKAFDNQDNRILYDKIHLYLDESQRELILKEQASNGWFVLELAKLYEAKKAFQKAYDTLSKSFDNISYYAGSSMNDERFQMIIRLCHDYFDGKNIMEWIEKYMETTPSIDSFKTAIQYRPNDRILFENHFETHHPTTFAKILETENRLKEVVQLFKNHEYAFRNGSAIYGFFQRHKTLFPDDATIVFKKELEIYSKEAKQYHYEKVAEILGELQPILDGTAFRAIVMNIKSKYYRRTNLMGILKRKGW